MGSLLVSSEKEREREKRRREARKCECMPVIFVQEVTSSVFSFSSPFYSNAGSAALVFLLLAVSIGVFIILRLRRKARLANQGVRLGGGMMGRSNGMNDESHELEHLVEEPEEEEEDEDQDRNQGGRWSDGTARQGHRDSNVRENEEIFDVGNESDESEGKR